MAQFRKRNLDMIYLTNGEPSKRAKLCADSEVKIISGE